MHLIMLTVDSEHLTEVLAAITKVARYISNMNMEGVAEPSQRRNRNPHTLSVPRSHTGGLIGSAACALKIMQAQPDVAWRSVDIGTAMRDAKGYAVSGGSATASLLVKEGYAERRSDGTYHLTDKGRNFKEAA